VLTRVELFNYFVQLAFHSLTFYHNFCVQNTVLPAIIMQQVEKREIIEQLEKQLKLVSCDTVGNTK